MKLKVTTDDLNDPDVTCGTKANLGGHEVVVASGAGPCLEGNVLILNISYNITFELKTLSYYLIVYQFSHLVF